MYTTIAKTIATVFTWIVMTVDPLTPSEIEVRTMIDRIEDGYATLETVYEDGHIEMYTIPATQLVGDFKEGDVLYDKRNDSTQPH